MTLMLVTVTAKNKTKRKLNRFSDVCLIHSLFYKYLLKHKLISLN